MKLLIEIVLAVVLHPLAVVLVWIDLAGRRDLATAQKILWALFAMIWGLGPILYVVLGGGEMW